MEITLVEHDLRSADYKQIGHTLKGEIEIPKGVVTTYKGKVNGDNSSIVRLALNGKKIEGFISTGNDKYYIEPASNYSAKVTAEDFLVYRQKDLRNPKEITCSLVNRIEAGMRMVNTKLNGNSSKFDFVRFPFSRSSVLAQPGNRILNLATDADFEYLKIFGYNRQTQYDFSNALRAANANINETLNVVEGFYESSINMTFNIVYQYGWMYQDPYNNYDTVQHDEGFVLAAFQNWWNTYNPVGTILGGRDAAILFTGKPGVHQNIAYLGGGCSQQNAYVLMVGNFPVEGYGNYRYGSLAHEISHLFNANHLLQSELDANPDCYNSLQGISDPNRPHFGELRVCQFTLNVINTYLANNNCLSIEQ